MARKDGYKDENVSLLRSRKPSYETFSETTLESDSNNQHSHPQPVTQASSSRMPIMGSENFDIFHDKDRNLRANPPGFASHPSEEDGYSQKVLKVGTCSVSSRQPDDNHGRSAVEDSAAQARLLRKIDLRLVPLLVVCYFLQYLDKGSIGFASILGIIPDLNLHDQQYSWANSIFFFGYLIFSYPTSVLIVKFPIGKYVSVTVMMWAVILMLHAACTNGSGLMAVRFFLGIGEATVVPAFAILVGLFYKREEQPLRQCAFFIGDGIAGITGGLIAYGIAHIDGRLATWRCLFLIYGAATVFFGVILFFTLPSGPSTAYFLTEDEQKMAVKRVQGNGSRKTGQYKKSQVIEALKDPQAWLLTLNTVCVNIATGGLSGFGNIIIQGFGFDLFETLLLQIPFGVSQIVFVSIGAYLGSFVKNARLFAMVFFMVVSITGTLMMFLIPAQHRAARVGGACLASAFSANLPMATSMVTSNITGFTKKATVMSMVFVAYCVGRIAGPHFFLDSESPRYQTGMRTIVSVFSIAAAIAIILRIHLMMENARRDKMSEVSPVMTSRGSDAAEDDLDITDREDMSFRYLM
ncbi:major facilitator superfamily domain-containing protein [Rhexocercosporidium sp. MPI-PUGE-AT-0058]|nr:major facilitator superfamily domain-containing protein [Rhexocercosporidium sp. MPI-PUGE-AT-0058]